MHRFQRPIRPLGAVVALGLLATACGSGTGAEIEAATPAAEPTTTGEAVGTTAAPESSTSASAETAGESAAPHFFPNLDTVDIVDGSTINLADQLSGGDTPVLLWFWAPH
jgi:hypothetical protein